HLANDALQLLLARTGLARRLPNSQADLARTRKGDHFNIGVIDQVCPDDRAVAREKVQNAGRNSSLLEYLHQKRAQDGRRFGRFHDHGIAGYKRGRDHSAQNGHRKIPRRNHERDAARPVMLIAFFTWNVLGESWPADQSHLVCIEPAEIHRLPNAASGFGPWFADFETFNRGELESIPIEYRSRAFEQLAALLERPTPRDFEGC